MNALIRTKLSVILMLLMSCSLCAQEGPPINDTLAQRLQNVLYNQKSKFYELHGISAAVIMSDHNTWVGASGISHPGCSMTTDMLFRIGSNTKPFTAAVILQLAEEGLLTLEDSLNRWLPSYPYIDSTITIRQLLNHTSGLHDVVDWLGGYGDSIFADINKYWTPEEIILTFIDEPSFSPGEGYEYSNTNYLLLGMIIEKATQSDFVTQMQNRVAEPLQLNNTYFAWTDTINDYCAHPWSQLALPAQGDVLWSFKSAMSSIMFGYGNFISTPGDIAKWGKHLFEADVFNQVTLEQMLTFIPMDIVESNPHRTGYGLGVMRYEICNRELWGHGGHQYAYVTQLVYYPEDSISIAVFLNDRIDLEKEYYARGSITTELFAYVLSFLHGYPKVEYNLNSNYLTINLDWASAVDSSFCVYNRGWGKDTIDISIDYGLIDTNAISIDPSSFELAPGDSQSIKLIMVPNKINNWSNFKLIVDSKFNCLSSPIEVTLNIIDHVNMFDNTMPSQYVLKQNYPNPFNPKTVISWQLAVGSEVNLSIFNVLGQKVATLVSSKQKAGFHSVEWDAGGFASGVYYYRLQAGEYVACKKLVLLK